MNDNNKTITTAAQPLDLDKLSGDIMNLPNNCKGDRNFEIAYKTGHRDARHAAAELVSEQAALIAQARAAQPAGASFSEADIPADAPRAFAKRYSALLEENRKLKAQIASDDEHFYTFSKPEGWINLLNPGQSWEEWTHTQGVPTAKGWKVMGRDAQPATIKESLQVQPAGAADSTRLPAEATEKKAKLSLSLRADSGYMADETHRISAEQWGRICAIVNEKE